MFCKRKDKLSKTIEWLIINNVIDNNRNIITEKSDLNRKLNKLNIFFKNEYGINNLKLFNIKNNKLEINYDVFNIINNYEYLKNLNQDFNLKLFQNTITPNSFNIENTINNTDIIKNYSDEKKEYFKKYFFNNYKNINFNIDKSILKHIIANDINNNFANYLYNTDQNNDNYFSKISELLLKNNKQLLYTYLHNDTILIRRNQSNQKSFQVLLFNFLFKNFLNNKINFNLDFKQKFNQIVNENNDYNFINISQYSDKYENKNLIDFFLNILKTNKIIINYNLLKNILEYDIFKIFVDLIDVNKFEESFNNYVNYENKYTHDILENLSDFNSDNKLNYIINNYVNNFKKPYLFFENINKNLFYEKSNLLFKNYYDLEDNNNFNIYIIDLENVLTYDNIFKEYYVDNYNEELNFIEKNKNKNIFFKNSSYGSDKLLINNPVNIFGSVINKKLYLNKKLIFNNLNDKILNKNNKFEKTENFKLFINNEQPENEILKLLNCKHYE